MSNNTIAIGLGALIGVAGRILADGEKVTVKTVAMGAGQVVIAGAVGVLIVHFYAPFQGAPIEVVTGTAIASGFLSERVARLVRLGKISLKAGPVEINDERKDP
jgi:hypothetical protein